MSNIQGVQNAKDEQPVDWRGEIRERSRTCAIRLRGFCLLVIHGLFYLVGVPLRTQEFRQLNNLAISNTV
jgi:hypothetical protein